MSKTATYHSPDGTSRLLTVLAENADGTVDLGAPRVKPEDKDVLDIGKCPVARDGKVGTCTLTNPRPLSDEEKAAEKAANEAAAAAAEPDKTKGQTTHTVHDKKVK